MLHAGWEDTVVGWVDTQLWSKKVLAAVGFAILLCMIASYQKLITQPVTVALSLGVLLIWRVARPILIWRGMQRCRNEIAPKYCPDMVDVCANWIGKDRQNRNFWVAASVSHPEAGLQTSSVHGDASKEEREEEEVFGCVGIHIGVEGCPGGSYGKEMGALDAAVFRLSTSKHCRGRGIGSKLMDAAELYAFEQGVQRVFLETANAGAIKFYEKRGYAKQGDCQSHGGFILIKRLS